MQPTPPNPSPIWAFSRHKPHPAQQRVISIHRDMKKPPPLSLFLVVCFVGVTSFTATAETSVTEPTLTNISTRAFVQTGDNVVIGGFFVEGAPPKRVIIRAIGPDLTKYGIPNALANPTLELHDGIGALIASNNNWVTTIIGGIITATQVHDIQASGYAPSDPLDSAIIADLPAGNYTAILRGVNNLTGVALVEVYDLNPEAGSILGDISTRAYVQTGDNVMIGGFTIPGTQPKGVILRAIGPELSKYGIPNTLADRTLELYDSTGALIASNDNWQHTAIDGIIAADRVRGILDSGLAPENQNESVINATLLPGSYTAIVRGVNNTTGVALLSGHRTSPTYTWTGAADIHWEIPLIGNQTVSLKEATLLPFHQVLRSHRQFRTGTSRTYRSRLEVPTVGWLTWGPTQLTSPKGDYP